MPPSVSASETTPALGRRAACAAFGAGLLALTLAACSDLEPKKLEPGEKHFWEREEQRD